MSRSSGSSRRWRRLVIGLGLVLLIVGLWRWNAYRVARPFHGRWRLVVPREMGTIVAEFQPDGRAELPWVRTEAGSVVRNSGLRWKVASGELIVGPYSRIRPVRDLRTRLHLWFNSLWFDVRQAERLEIIEVTPQKIRLRLKADGAPESVYERLENP